MPLKPSERPPLDGSQKILKRQKALERAFLPKYKRHALEQQRFVGYFWAAASAVALGAWLLGRAKKDSRKS